MRKIKLSLVVPFYNEGEAIRKTFKVLTSYLDTHYGDEYELLFLNDGSTDNSAELVREEISKNKKTKLISYSKNKGRGFALSRGFRQACGSIIGYIDSDLEIHQWYQDKEKFPACLYESQFLNDLLSQGYRYCEGRGFGYFRNYEQFTSAVKSYKLSPEDLIAYEWDGDTERFTNVTDQLRESEK